MLKYIFFIIVLISSTIANADQTDAICKIYYKDNNKLEQTRPCQFSQYQGHIYLSLQSEKAISLSPIGNLPGNFVDENNQPVYRKKGLGQKGQIFQFKDKLIYVYWKSKTSKNTVATTNTVKIKPLNYNQVLVNIHDGKINLKLKLHRQINDIFTGINKTKLIFLQSDSGKLIIFDTNNGQIISNYKVMPIPTFENPDTMCDPKTEPC